ncbi:MAG: hypothetical protein HLUCCA01_10045 [Bacteroidetes bacterium HLUCCA01]|nr:MAG: hypothetical protein HLUCCA01_10045 [Bacteroidetes bacterium HLUCCA01]
MKYALLTLPAILLFTACTQPDPNEGWELYGDYITATDFVALDEVIDEFSEEEEKTMKIGGTLKQVCQSKGCWTTLETQDGRSLRMTFANYSFFVPTDAAGREIVAEGLAFKKVTSVNELRHYAEDANAPEEEIAAITEPEVEYSFEARGVLLR